MVFLIRKISSDRVLRVSVISFKARRALMGEMSIMNLRNWGLPIFTATLIKLRNVLVMNRLGLYSEEVMVILSKSSVVRGRKGHTLAV